MLEQMLQEQVFILGVVMKCDRSCVSAEAHLRIVRVALQHATCSEIHALLI